MRGGRGVPGKGGVVFATRQWLLRAGKGQAAGRFLSFRSCKREIERVRARETERERESEDSSLLRASSLKTAPSRHLSSSL